MLTVEKKTTNATWYKTTNLLYRIKNTGEDAVIWVNYNGYNVVLPMLLWDFNFEMEENDIPLKLDMSWNGHRGFVVNKEDVMYFLGLIELFCTEKKLSSMLLNESFSEKWYDET